VLPIGLERASQTRGEPFPLLRSTDPVTPSFVVESYFHLSAFDSLVGALSLCLTFLKSTFMSLQLTLILPNIGGMSAQKITIIEPLTLSINDRITRRAWKLTNQRLFSHVGTTMLLRFK
jgi:hypothetical protein